MQEAHGLLLEKSNFFSSGGCHDLNGTSHSGIDHKVTGASSSSVAYERDRDPSVSYVNSQAELLEKENGGNNQVEKGDMPGETSSSVFHEPVRLQVANESSVLADGVQGPGFNCNLSKEIEKGIYPDQNLGDSALSEMQCSADASRHDGGPVVSGVVLERVPFDKEKAEDQEKQVVEEQLKISVEPTDATIGEETSQFFDPPEESKVVGMNLSCESNQGSSLEKKMEVTASSQENSVNDVAFQLQSGEGTNKGSIKHYFLTDFLSSDDGCHGTQPKQAVLVKEMAVDARKEQLLQQEYLLMGSSIGGKIEQDGVFMKGSSTDEFESVMRHLYLSFIEKGILQLQLIEQTCINEDLHQHSSYEVHRLLNLVMKSLESKDIITEELVKCKSEFEFLAITKDEFESDCLIARREIELEHIKCCNLKSELHKSHEDLLHVSNELAIYRGSVDALQNENTNLLASLLSETNSRKKLAEEVEFLSNEQLKLTAALMEETASRKKITEERESLSTKNIKLSSELTSKQERLQIALENKAKLQNSLRELALYLEQLVEDNFYLSCNFDIYSAKIKEIEVWKFEETCHGQEGQSCNVDFINCTLDMSEPVYRELNANAASGNILKSNSLFEDRDSLVYDIYEKESDNYVLFKVLKEQLQVAKTKLQDVEESVHVIHNQFFASSEPSGISTHVGVSKLIKAFESKGQHVISGINEAPETVGENMTNLYALSREQTICLRNILDRMELELGKVEIHIMNNQQYTETLKKCKMDCEIQMHKNSSLQVVLHELAKKVVDYESKLYEMPQCIDELHKRANEEASGFLEEIELLKREVCEELFILKQERDAIFGMILEAVGKLDALTGLKAFEGFDTKSHVMASVDAAIVEIEKLYCKLEETNQNYITLNDSHDELKKSYSDIKSSHALTTEHFYIFYNNLVELTKEVQQKVGDAAIRANVENVLDLLPETCQVVLEYLQKLLSERAYLLSRNTELCLELSARKKEIKELNTQCKELEHRSNIRDELEITLLNKTNEIEELKRRCLLLVNQLENHESCKDLNASAYNSFCEGGDIVASKDANIIDNSCGSLVLRLEELVSFHLLNHKEIFRHIMLLMKHLQEANMVMELSADDLSLPLPTMLSQVLIPMVIKFYEELKLLTVSNAQKKNEIQSLKEGMGNIEDALDASRQETQLKTSEVEQLEQKLSSVREKLSIAVAKGKGLIVQRDSLKQSLLKKNSELEKSAQDLLLKEAVLDELEKKLNSSSEEERIEALESELSYIRNSATALRDSFLLKDSVLQRIEEVFEDLELPNDFRDKGVLEKIELLARFAIDHPSSTVTFLEQKSLEERTHSDARECSVIEGNTSCMWPLSNSDFDELKRKHEELQGKFYGLAEHNDMLEQSLLERNKLMHKWDEILGRIGLPPHVQTMRHEDKIEWLEKELSELYQERDCLQFKIDNLETSSEMLIVDTEESHKRISKLAAEVVAVKSEKEFFSESLEKLRFEYFALSEKAVIEEQDKENMQKELDDLQVILIENAQFGHYKEDMEKKLQKLHYLVNSTLMESDEVHFLSGGSLVEHLEESLKRMIENYTDLKISSNMVRVKEALLDKSCSDHGKIVLEESCQVHRKMVPEETLHEKESKLASISLELDKTSNKLASMEQDRDTIFTKCQSLMLEVEGLKSQIDLLNVENSAYFDKYQLLELELDAMGKQRDSLEENLAHEEQKIASVKEKLNLAVRKGKGVVQQRDNLKQTVDEMTSLVEQLKIDHRQQIEVLISEKSLLMNRFADLEMSFQITNQSYSRLLTALHAIDFESEANEFDPIQKLTAISKMLLDLRSSVIAAESDANKSKRTAELLLTELNDVQERNDILQDELVKAESSLTECSKQKNDSLTRLEHIMLVHFEERTRLAKNLANFMLSIDQMREGLLWSSRFLSEIESNDGAHFHFVKDLKKLTLDGFFSPVRNDQPLLLSSSAFSPTDPKNMGISWFVSDATQTKMHQPMDEASLFEHFTHADQALLECVGYCNELRKHLSKHSIFLDNKIAHLSETIDAVKRKNSSLKESSESLKRNTAHLESKLTETDIKINSIYKNLTLLYEACSTSVMEYVKRKSLITKNSATIGEDNGNVGIVMTLPSYAKVEEDKDVHSINEYVKVMAEYIVSTVRDTSSTNELIERTERELKSSILALQRELQEKDIQMNRVCKELVSQIKDAERVAEMSMAELDLARSQFSNLEKKAEEMESSRNLLEARLRELQDVEALSKQLQERISSFSETVNAKDQEIEALMLVLDEEETQMKALENKNKNMENLVLQSDLQFKNLEASHSKTADKLSTTIKKFDELHYLSESLLLEVENLQSQLSERESEISFLRQEVTRCTNDVLVSQENNKKYSSELHELLAWINAMISHFGESPVQFNDQEASQIHLRTDILGKKIASAITELEDLRKKVQCKDALLETERRRVEELLFRVEDLESSPHRIERSEEPKRGRVLEQQSSSKSSETLDSEQMVRNKLSSGPMSTIIRSGRKVNSDQISIAIDPEMVEGKIEDEDDDKAHGFKPLTMSRLIPRATRPIADRIDGIWVSAERLLMRQPTLRLAFLMYWVAVHALLASFI